MTDIPNTEYITVNANGIFVGGKPAIKYRGVRIYGINYVNDALAWIQEQNPNITELHVLSSETSGYFATVGNPSPEHGRYAWYRVKYKDGQFGGWVFAYDYTSAAKCASFCAYNCANGVRAIAAFRRAVLVTAFENDQNEENAQSDDLGYIDWAQKLGVHNVGQYEIIVRKTPEKTKKELKMAGKVVKFTNCDNVRHTVECCNNDVRYTCPYLKFLAEQEDYTDYYVTHAGETVRVELNFWQHSFAQNFPYPKAACASCMYNSKNRGR